MVDAARALLPRFQQRLPAPRVGVEAAGYNRMTTILEIRLHGGGNVSGRADFAKGSPAIPMSYQEVAEKFLDCAAFARWPATNARSVVGVVRELETVSDVNVLAALLRA